VTGLVEVKHGDGVYLLRSPRDLIPSLASAIAGSEGDHPMIWEVREAIEVQAAHLAARRRTAADLREMHAALDAMAASIAAGGDGIDGDRRFHLALADAAHNPLLRELVGQLADVIDRTSATSLTLPGRPPISLEAHRAILDAIERADEGDAAERMREHVMQSGESVASRPVVG
jgi:GntR family transcriptional repressor for pyruvate dehydrogenase complex